MTDVKKLKEFVQKAEWEGGLWELAGWGKLDSGDEELNSLMDRVSALNEEITMYYDDLCDQHKVGYQYENEDER